MISSSLSIYEILYSALYGAATDVFLEVVLHKCQIAIATSCTPRPM